MAFDLKITGLKEVERDLQKLAKAKPKAALRGVVKWAERTMTRSKIECPVRFGTLRSSGHVEVDEPALKVTLAYGGAAGAYAAKVHETHPTKSKFLERPMLEGLGDLPKMVKEEVDKS